MKKTKEEIQAIYGDVELVEVTAACPVNHLDEDVTKGGKFWIGAHEVETFRKAGIIV